MAFPHGQPGRILLYACFSYAAVARCGRVVVPPVFLQQDKTPQTDIIPLVIILVCWIYGWIGGDTLYRHRDMLLLLIGGYSLLLTALLLHTTNWLLRQIRQHMQEEYSNSEDFPVRFAGFVVFMPVLYLGSAWWLFITGDHDYNMWFQLVISVMRKNS